MALGGDGSTRPTFFELVAAERLMPSLKAATIYSLSVSDIVCGHAPLVRAVCESLLLVSGNHALSAHHRHHTDVLSGSASRFALAAKWWHAPPVSCKLCQETPPQAALRVLTTPLRLQIFAQRRPTFHRLLDWEDEVFALITALLDRQSLQNGSSSFAESLYGLRRAGRTASQGLPEPALLHHGQQRTLAALVSSSTCSTHGHALLRCPHQHGMWQAGRAGSRRLHASVLLSHSQTQTLAVQELLDCQKHTLRCPDVPTCCVPWLTPRC